jgi:hypothetical protein
LRIKTPKGQIEVKIKEYDNLITLAERTYIAGGFIMPEMKQSLAIYFQRQLPSTIVFRTPQAQQFINWKAQAKTCAPTLV